MNQNSILDQLIYDDASGALTYRGIRYLLIRPETLVGFQKTVETYSPEGAREALFQGGYQGGYLSSKKYKEQHKLSDSETIGFMMTMGAEIGWGNFQLLKYNAENRKLQIRVENSAFAAAYGESTEGVCHLICGVLSGLATVLFARKSEVLEIACLAKGDEYCDFQIQE